ncbi:peroxiredoxin family protein [Algibacillus agarilyticus]|uniref:peroxiredoxin family protein n=1 Tax=Algibacillus agarilyticus TaxID=2234133 RepID=UPI000DD07928|nr:redoxin domain-containing protein [Algibacillus agarilyticus]
MTKTTSIISSLFCVLLFGCTASGVPEAQLNQQSYSDISGVQVQTGQIAPSFSLKNSNNKTVELNDILKSKHAMLVFYRGEWCPFCISNLSSFETILPELEAFNVQLVAISPDSVQTNQNTQRKFGQDYLFLSDENHKTSMTYGIKTNKDYPHPGVFLINQQGKIVWFYVSENVKERPTGQQMLDVIKKRLK